MKPRRTLSWTEGLLHAKVLYGEAPEGADPFDALYPTEEPVTPAPVSSRHEVDPTQAPPPFPGEHRNQRVSYGGLRWVWRRRRDENGRYVPDNPNTPVTEAWQWVVLQ